jgi:hypothetical protein
MSVENYSGIILTGNQRKTHPSATLSTANPTWTDPGVNMGFRSERSMTEYLIHGTAIPGRFITVENIWADLFILILKVAVDLVSQ